VPLVLAATARSRRLLWLLTAVLGVTTFVVYALQISHGSFSLREPYFINRVLDVVAIVVMAAMLDVWIRSVEVREAQMRLLDVQNRKLEAANAELVVREAQIARQSVELEQRRREAEEASGRKTRLLASVSHDMRAPLNAIHLTANVIGRTATDPRLAAQMPPMIERLQHTASSLLEAVSDLLDVTSFDSGRVERHDSVFALAELVAEKCDDVLPLAQSKSLRVDVDVHAAPPLVFTDRAKLGRVLSNLLTNAIKFTDAGAVRVAVETGDDAGVRIAVSDTGIGIAPERLAHLFDGYGQITDSLTRGPGWGLGLAICRRLVDLLGGTIAAESMPDRGSTVTVRLPAACIVAAHEPLPLPRSQAAPPH
jgi:signal transduction histidine kinase